MKDHDGKIRGRTRDERKLYACCMRRGLLIPKSAHGRRRKATTKK